MDTLLSSRLAIVSGAVVVVLAVVGFSWRPWEGSPPPEPVPVYAGALDDTNSAEISGITTRHQAIVEAVYDDAPDGAFVTVFAITGATTGSVCDPAEVMKTPTGNNETRREQSRAAIRADLLDEVDVLLGCTEERDSKGSDVVGSFIQAARLEDDGHQLVKFVAATDGIHVSRDWSLTGPKVRDEEWRAQQISTLERDGLVPDLSGVEVVMTDLGVRTGDANPVQTAALIDFWRAYLRAANTTLDEQ